MIFPIVAVTVVVLAFAIPSFVAALSARRQSASATPAPEPEPFWWPKFERDFRAYVRSREAELRHEQGS